MRFPPIYRVIHREGLGVYFATGFVSIGSNIAIIIENLGKS